MDVLQPFIGGCLIGLATTIMLYVNGRITGNSGILGGLWTLNFKTDAWKIFYLAGLVLGTLLYDFIGGDVDYQLKADYPIIIVAGLLVGYGTRLGSGCTSGHGICGLARFSKRSLVATLTFMGTGILTVLILKLF